MICYCGTAVGRPLSSALLLLAAVLSSAVVFVPIAALAEADEPEIRTHLDIAQAVHEAGGEPAPGSPAAKLGAASDVAEQFIRLAPEALPHSELLTERSRRLPRDSEGRRRLARLQALRQGNRYSQIVDARFADDLLASIFVVYVPRPTQRPKITQIIHLIRQENVWRVTLDLNADAAATLGEPFACVKTGTAIGSTTARGIIR